MLCLPQSAEADTLRRIKRTEQIFDYIDLVIRDVKIKKAHAA